MLSMTSYRPTVRRYRLVKVGPDGGVTVELRPGATRRIPPAAGRRFYFAAEDMRAAYRWHLADALETAQRRALELKKELEMPDLGIDDRGVYYEDEFYSGGR
jgi:hypothetical protein